MRRPNPLPTRICFALALAGCTGQIGAGGQRNGAATGPPGGRGGPAATNGTGGATAPAGGVNGSQPDGGLQALGCDITPDPGPSPLRRLTRWEYDNTVQDLLGDVTAPAKT